MKIQNGMAGMVEKVHWWRGFEQLPCVLPPLPQTLNPGVIPVRDTITWGCGAQEEGDLGEDEHT
ncbi:hypothetical protein E2C01_042409 [Portunus trituberculatus]|uniref:Uncharacterized protein n=1 Tax=Portunus trituberculatus TaxID=210409 RepID=A0A5B7FTL6_PORTR|nr:hypothetical protein [Portunus trituberculatus]